MLVEGALSSVHQRLPFQLRISVIVMRLHHRISVSLGFSGQTGLFDVYNSIHDASMRCLVSYGGSHDCNDTMLVYASHWRSIVKAILF